MNLESNTTPKINKQHLKSKNNNQQTLTNNNYIVIYPYTWVMFVCACMHACINFKHIQ